MQDFQSFHSFQHMTGWLNDVTAKQHDAATEPACRERITNLCLIGFSGMFLASHQETHTGSRERGEKKRAANQKHAVWFVTIRGEI